MSEDYQKQYETQNSEDQSQLEDEAMSNEVTANNEDEKQKEAESNFEWRNHIDDIIAVLNDGRFYTVLTGGINSSEVKAIIAKFERIVERKEEEEREAAEEELKRESRKEALLEMIKEQGFSEKDLLEIFNDSPAPKRGRRRNSRRSHPEKYVYEVDGETKYWSGQGRRPAAISEALEDGTLVLSDFRNGDVPEYLDEEQ